MRDFQGPREGEDMLVVANEYGIYFWGDENILELDRCIVAQT